MHNNPLFIGSDPFFGKSHCDRCHQSLNGTFIMSWFTEQTICMTCSGKERDIKKQLRQNGHGDMEGCGYVPNPEELSAR
jgi:hypothetical protein